MRVVFEPGWEHRIDGDVTELLDRLGEQIAVDARTICPVDTGRLRDSIEHEVDVDSVRIGTNVDYAVYQEEGTRYMDPQPFLRPALYRVRSL